MLVIPVGEGAVQKMIRITRINETEFKEETFGDFSFVPMLENKAK
jgi:protein-L-isoaspartate(D-aspartate) O-methyltransferase